VNTRYNSTNLPVLHYYKKTIPSGDQSSQISFSISVITAWTEGREGGEVQELLSGLEGTSTTTDYPCRYFSDKFFLKPFHILAVKFNLQLDFEFRDQEEPKPNVIQH
jgi:hypothetical protein